MIHLPCSYGELVDKITILKIKAAKISDSEKLANITRELNLLEEKFNSLAATTAVSSWGRAAELYSLGAKLMLVNGKLWEVEDDLRELEKNKRFDDEFIELARSVYKNNDERSRLKRLINELFDSKIIEEKSYTEYV